MPAKKKTAPAPEAAPEAPTESAQVRDEVEEWCDKAAKAWGARPSCELRVHAPHRDHEGRIGAWRYTFTDRRVLTRLQAALAEHPRVPAGDVWVQLHDPGRGVVTQCFVRDLPDLSRVDVDRAQEPTAYAPPTPAATAGPLDVAQLAQLLDAIRPQQQAAPAAPAPDQLAAERAAYWRGWDDCEKMHKRADSLARRRGDDDDDDDGAQVPDVWAKLAERALSVLDKPAAPSARPAAAPARSPVVALLLDAYRAGRDPGGALLDELAEAIGQPVAQLAAHADDYMGELARDAEAQALALADPSAVDWLTRLADAIGEAGAQPKSAAS